MKRFFSLLVLIALMLTMVPVQGEAATSLPTSIYLTQAGSSTCTLCSATMMLRSRMYLSGNENWSSITESALRSTAWIEGSGLRHSFTYKLNGNSMTVAHATTSGISSSTLKSLLNSHPEGIVLYCGKLPHAVFLTDYDGDTFYCADTISGYSGKRIALASSYLGKKYGSQASVLSNVTAYWYISSYSITPSTNLPQGVLDFVNPGTNKVTVRGWAFDRDNLNREVALHVYIGSTLIGTGSTGVIREDVHSVYGTGKYHGYEFECEVPSSLGGSQKVDVYAIDVETGNNPCLGSITVNIPVDKEAPVISNVKVSNITTTGYTITCKVIDNTGVSRVQFPTWTEPQQDDLATDWGTNSAYTGTKNGDTYTYQVKFSEHNNEKSGYATHIYAYDNYGNQSSSSIEDYGYDRIAAQYTVSFNANNGTGEPSSQIKTHGKTLTLSSTKPTRTGYTFLGWATSSTATSAAYSAGGSFTTNANTTLYAVWKANTYTVSYNANGGAGEPSSQTKTYGKTLTLSSTKPTRTGYTFQGWATSSSATSAAYSAGGSFSTNANTTLYAVWKANTYTVSYNANGGTGAPSNQTKIHGQTLTLNSTKPVMDQHTFLGWATSSNATSAAYSAGAKFDIDANTTLYAVWKHVCAAGHSYGSWSQTKAPTCTATGTERRDCSKCDHFETRNITATGHSLGNWSQTKAPNCTTGGTERRDCAKCDHYETRTVAATGHSYTSKVTKPTCTAEGYTTYTCSCGDSYTDSKTNATGHSFGNWSQTKAPTCTATGTERRDCNNCDHYETRSVAATGHSYTSVVTKPTCTAEGYTTYTCSCGDSYTDSKTNATGHSMGNWTQTKVPTCTATGTERRDCSKCDHYETRTVAATGHSYTTKVTKPTCTADGYTTYTCSCGDSYTADKTTATGHSFGSWTQTEAPTCTVFGTERRDCINCDHYQTRDVASTGHSFGAWTQTKAPTATEEGEERRDCANCDYYETRAVAATGEAAIITQPESVEVKSGETAAVTVEAVGDGLTYTWYYKNPGASSFTRTTAFTGPTYSVAMTEARSGRQVYCLVKDQYGNKVQSDVVTLTMYKTPLAIVTQPESIEVKSGETALVEFEAQGDGLTYTWYYKNKGASSFTKTSTFTGPSYSVAMSASRDGRQVYCLVTDQYGSKVKTDIVTLTVTKTPLAIVTQPESVEVKYGETALVTLEAQGDGLTYTWYYKNKGAASFTKTTAFTGPSYSVGMTASRSGRQVYCLVKDEYGNKIKSDVATLTMYSEPLAIVSQSGDMTVGAGETAVVTVEATGDGLTYEWYYKNAGASSYKKTSTFTGPVYTLEMNASRSGRRVYCKITDAYGNTVKTKSVVLTMETTPLEILSQPEGFTVAEGETGEIYVEATGDGLKYEWYYKNATASKFTKTSTFTGPEYSLTMTASRSGRHVYCKITDAYGKSVTTDIVALNMESQLELIECPEDVIAANGETVEITVFADGTGLKYAWYYRNAGKAEFTKTSTFTGDSYSLEMNSTRNGREVYCVITDSYGNTVATDVVTFRME